MPPTYKITFSHSKMRPDYIGRALKTAHTEREALDHLGAYNKKTNQIIDKRRNVLSNIQIHEAKH